MRRSRGIAIAIGVAVGVIATAFFATAAAAKNVSAQATYHEETRKAVAIGMITPITRQHLLSVKQ